MAQQVHLYSPNTSRRGSNSNYLGTLKVVKSKSSVEDNCDGLAKGVYHARIPQRMRHLSAVQLHNGLQDHFLQSCCCQHDCCGCYFGGVAEVHKRGRYLTFITRYLRNV